jgi:tripartite ATP-independent transporter DctM subunit
MTDAHVAIVMLCLFIAAIFLGFPIAFTLLALAFIFGWYAMGERIVSLIATNSGDVMTNDVLVAIPLFLFMGYVVERANILDRLFRSIQVASRGLPASLAVAALVTCALFATATGIVGAVVTLMGLLAFPAMLKAGYDTKLASGVICAGGTLGILIPPSIMLIVYGAAAGESVVRLYAAAMLPGFLLAGLYVVYTVGRAILNPSLAPKLPADEMNVPMATIARDLLYSFFPLAILILAVLGAIFFGFATPSEAAAVGAMGALVLAAAYGALTWTGLRESVYLTARTSAMVCFLFIGSTNFASVYSYLGGQKFVEEFMLGLDLSPTGFLIVTRRRSSFFSAGRWNGPRSSSSSCRSFCPCSTISASTRSSSASWWHSTCSRPS